MKATIQERFIRYAKVNTRSDERSFTTPSTPSQREFTLELARELKEIGFSDVHYNEENAYLTATIPSNVDYPTLTVGFIAHVDTADFHSVNIQPQVHDHYDGEDIILNEALGIVMRTREFPQLKDYIGETVITTDGTTLLGADDKAGITSIVTLGEHLLAHPEIKHGAIRVAFGPDEEIGTRGAKKFDVKAFGANFAYTVDGGRRGRLTYDNFNASQVNVTIQGTSVHPGNAKDTMVNALLVAAKLATSLPLEEVPEKTTEREGFFFLMRQSGGIDFVEQSFYVRDHDMDRFNERLEFIQKRIHDLNQEIGEERITYEIVDQYRNMKNLVDRYPFVLDIAKEAYETNQLTPVMMPLRGGTDGAVLATMGLPTPNLFSGTENGHGKYEFVTVETMALSIAVLQDIVTLTAHKSASITTYPTFN